jgi:hydroxymethylbilane synthase
MAQATQVQALLASAEVDSEILPMTTSGDEGAPTESSQTGLKGLWIDSIVEALRNGEIDVAVHSAKDLPAGELEGLTIGAVPERADARDVLILRGDGELASGALVGTSSLRRQAQIRAAFPQVRVTPMRGNVDTRLRRLQDGEVDAAILAAAGLSRLGLTPEHMRPLEVHEMIPAPGQGALAVQCRESDRETLAVLARIDHRTSHLAVDAERALMARVGGGCTVPFGAIAAVKTDMIRLAAVVASPDGEQLVKAAGDGEDPDAVADLVARDLFEHGADAILAQVRRA